MLYALHRRIPSLLVRSVTPVVRVGGNVLQTLLAGFVVLAQRLLAFERWGDEIKELPKFAVTMSLLVLQLLIENFFVWCAPSRGLACPSVECVCFVH